ncbi:MAG: cytochrome C biogenesis protein [Candidatus Sabulitectum sp.]|nr:cytochrome C biogenesis protein [Candidatus Sabulitectum sp.]
MGDLIASFTGAVESAAPVAVPLALLWGVLSIVLSPCHLASIPLVVGYISRQGNTGSNKAFSISAVFSLGIMVTIILVGLITAAAGRLLGDIGQFGYYFSALVMLYFGLNLLDVLPSPFKGDRNFSSRRSGLAGAFVLGLIFGIALGPCTFAFMAPILGVAFTTGREYPVFAILLVTAFSAGHCGVIVGAGTFSGAIQKFLKWNEKSTIVSALRKICGVLVVLGGLYTLYKYA